MKTTIVIFVLTFNVFTSFGQSDNLIVSKLCLKFSPLSIIDPYSGSSLRIGSEYKLKGKFAIYSELGVFFPKSIFNATSFRKNNGLSIEAELKYYVNKQKIVSGTYYSFDLFCKYQTYTTKDSIDITPNYLKDYTIYKNIYCANLKYGEMIACKCGIVLDFSVGLGIRYKVSHSTLTLNENNNIIGVGDYSTNIITNKAGKFIYPNFLVGIKIGYRIK